MQDVLAKLELFQKELQKNGFTENSERVKQKHNDFNEPFMLMLIGEGNFGKSTLINSLFNKQVAPISRLPKTWKIDIYQNSEKEEVLLYYKNNTKPLIVNIDEANLICKEEENKTKNNDSWKSDLYQVKWRIKSDWLENILLIDTPGFSQFRSNSTYSNFNLFGTKGIQLQSFDGFEYYFYRADFVFWCIKATKLEDADTLNALKNVCTEKSNVIGIITFMERIPLERWDEIKLKAADLYGNYIKEFLFFTPQENKNSFTNNTVSEIKEYINAKINTNLRKLKNASLLNYYSEELRNYCTSLDKTSEIYDKNISKYLSLIEDVNNDFNSIEKHIETEQKRVFESIFSPIEGKLNTIYLRSNDNPETFKYLVENELLNRHSLQKQIESIYQKIKDEISSQNLLVSHKLVWDIIVISSKNYHQDEIINLQAQNENFIESFQAYNNLAVDFLFEGFDGFNMAVGGIAAAIGMFALGPIGLIAGALGYLFGESKQTKVVRKAKEEIGSYINKVNLDIKKEVIEIIKNHKKNIIKKIDNSFREFNGNSKDEILKNFYWTDSVFSNKLQIKPNGSIIDCLNDKKQLLTYFPKLLKYDSEREPVWDKNADELFNNEVDNIFNKVSKEIYKVENNIKSLINDKKLADMALFNDEIASLDKYLATTILSNPLVSSTDFVERLVYSNGIKVNTVSSAYNSKLQKTKSVVIVKERELQLLWDQKVIDLIWDAIKNDIYKLLLGKDSKLSQSKINDFCDYEYQIIFDQIYSDVLKKTKIFDADFRVDINSYDEIRRNLIPQFQSRKFSFKENIHNSIQNDLFLASLKSFNISDLSKFIDDALQGRLTKTINDVPKTIVLRTKHKRFSGRILLSSFPIFIIGANHMFPFSFISNLETRENIHQILSSNITLIIFSLLFLLMIFMQIRTRMKVKREIKDFVKSIFNEFGEELYGRIQKKFKNQIMIKIKTPEPKNVAEDNAYYPTSQGNQKEEFCPNGHGKMEPWSGLLRCWICGFTNNSKT